MVTPSGKAVLLGVGVSPPGRKHLTPGPLGMGSLVIKVHAW